MVYAASWKVDADVGCVSIEAGRADTLLGLHAADEWQAGFVQRSVTFATLKPSGLFG